MVGDMMPLGARGVVEGARPFRNVSLEGRMTSISVESRGGDEIMPTGMGLTKYDPW